MRGLGYDGASNMRGEWHGLKALVMKDCPYAYYVHYFVHRLQLTLVAASREVIPGHQFFAKLTSIINVICASGKRHDELQKAKSIEIARLLEFDEIKTGKGANQIGTLRRVCDTRWGSHFNLVCSLLNMFISTCVVLQSIIEDGSYPCQRANADATYTNLRSFEFVLILHLIKEVRGKTNTLSKALQRKSQDIGNAIELVPSTKTSLNKYRNSGWGSLFEHVTIFCEKHEIELPDLKARYKSTRYRPRRHDNQVDFEHYYRVDIFLCTLHKQLHVLDNQFNDQAVDLLTLCSALVPKRKDSKVFGGDLICSLVNKYYPTDFTDQERILLKFQLELLDIAKTKNSKLSGISTISELCRFLAEIEKKDEYFLLDRLIRQILTLSVSTATTERAFSAMKLSKNRLFNRMSDDFLASSLVIYIEREVANRFDSNSIIDEFKNLKGRRAEL